MDPVGPDMVRSMVALQAMDSVNTASVAMTIAADAAATAQPVRSSAASLAA
jgi:hypothetical protein